MTRSSPAKACPCPDLKDQPAPPALTVLPVPMARKVRLVLQAQKAIPAILDRRVRRVPMALRVPQGRKVMLDLQALRALTVPQERKDLPGLTVRKVRKVILAPQGPIRLYPDPKATSDPKDRRASRASRGHRDPQETAASPQESS